MATEYERRAKAAETGWNPLTGFGSSKMASVGAGSFQPQNVRDALENITAAYTQAASPTGTRGEGIPGQLPGQARERAGAGYQAPYPPLPDGRSGLQDALDAMMYTTVGGPNAALISSLQAQKAQLQKNYGQNKADANNLYGELSSDIETYGEALQQRYTTDIGAMATAQEERQQGLADLQTQRDADRARVAASLGIAAEDVQTPQSTALQEIAGLSSAAATNWENLFKANQLLAEGSTGRQLAGAKATQADQLMAMKRFLDAQSLAIDSQIAAERMKAPTQELTDIGKALRSLEVDELVRQAQAAFPERYGAGEGPDKTDLIQGFETAQKNIADLYGQVLSQSDLLQMFDNISKKKLDAQMYGPSAQSQLTPLETILSNALNFRESDFG